MCVYIVNWNENRKYRLHSRSWSGVKEKGKKKPVIVTKVFDYKNVKYTKYNLKFN